MILKEERRRDFGKREEAVSIEECVIDGVGALKMLFSLKGLAVEGVLSRYLGLGCERTLLPTARSRSCLRCI